MRRKIDVRVRVDGETRNPLADIPDICPTCGRPVVNPTYLGALTTIYGGKLQAAFACSGDDCNSVIVGVYDELIAGYGYKLSSILPQVVRDPENIPASVRTVSPQFAEIYKQAFHAEQYGLDQICGTGYRKALEYLIKDFAIKTHPKEKRKIRASYLDKCIREFVDNEDVKDLATRAAWLGNDETHYDRRFKDKDIKDLKELIDATVSWINANETRKRFKKSMPKPR